MALISRIKTWVTNEKVLASDLNAEFDNVLDNLTALKVDDYSGNVGLMQTATDPGEVGTESLATTLAGELARLRFMLKEVTGEDEWYESPVSSLLGLSNAVGTGLTDNRLVSGRLLSGSNNPAFLVPNGAARTVKCDGTPTTFIYYIDGVEYSITTDVTLTGLTAAPSSNNTCLVNDAVAADQDYTKFTGEDNGEIPVDAAGTEITGLIGKFAAFKLYNGTATEYFVAYVASATSLTKVRRGYFFDSTDAAIPRVYYTDNDTITLLKLTWVFATTAGALTATYNNPVWSDDEPTSPAIGDYWFDYSTNLWKVYGVGSYATANAVLIGICVQDTTNTVAARSFEFFANYAELNTVELTAESNTQVKSRLPGSVINVYGVTLKNEGNLHTWDMTLDLDSGVPEAASTYYYFYLTATGDKIISDVRPHNRTEDLQGYYHPHRSWRCVGSAFNDASSHLTQVQSYYTRGELPAVRALIAAEPIRTTDEKILLSGATAAYYLRPAAQTKGQSFNFIHNGTAISQVYTITPAGAETIGGAATYIMRIAGHGVTLFSDGSNYLVEYERCPSIDSEIHLDAGNGHGSSSTYIRRYSNARRNTGTPYMTINQSSTTGDNITVNVTGIYAINVQDVRTANAGQFGISVNTSTPTTNIGSMTYAQGFRASAGSESGAVIPACAAITLVLTAGDIIRGHTDSLVDGASTETVLQVVLIRPILGV